MTEEPGKVRANYGWIVRGDLAAIEHLMEQFNSLLSKSNGVQLVHGQASASKLWISEECPDRHGIERCRIKRNPDGEYVLANEDDMNDEGNDWSDE